MIIIILVFLIIDALIGLWIGRGKGRSVEGLLLGLFLGFIGWIIVACLRPSYDEQVRREVTRRQVAEAADAGPAVPGTLSGVTSVQLRGMTSAERRAYIKGGLVPVRFTVRRAS